LLWKWIDKNLFFCQKINKGNLLSVSEALDTFSRCFKFFFLQFLSHLFEVLLNRWPKYLQVSSPHIYKLLSDSLSPALFLSHTCARACSCSLFLSLSLTHRHTQSNWCLGFQFSLILFSLQCYLSLSCDLSFVLHLNCSKLEFFHCYTLLLFVLDSPFSRHVHKIAKSNY
jgi:hypothetical protein